MSIDVIKYPQLAKGVNDKTIIVDDDNDYRLLNGSPFGLGATKTKPVRPVKLAAVGNEVQAEKLLIERGVK